MNQEMLNGQPLRNRLLIEEVARQIPAERRILIPNLEEERVMKKNQIKSPVVLNLPNKEISDKKPVRFGSGCIFADMPDSNPDLKSPAKSQK
jgi:hypothetical protein